MSIEHQERENLSNGSGTTPTLGQVVEASLARMKAVWRANQWDPAQLSEYRRVLTSLREPDLVERVVTAIIDGTEERFPPPPGVFATTGRNIRRRTELDDRPPRHTSWLVDEGALRDALAYREQVTDPDDQLYAEAAIRSIRARLEAKGRPSSDPFDAHETRFIQADPKPYDPPGTLRLRVVPGFPRGPRNGGIE